MGKVRFSIVLPTFNRLYALKDIFLPGLEKQTFVEYEIIIVDDCSSDGSDEYFKSIEYKKDFPVVSQRTIYLKNKENKGSPESRNIGFKESSGDWIFMAEDDLELSDSGFFEKSNKLIGFLYDDGILSKEYSVFCPKRIEYNKRGYYKNFNHQFINVGFLSGEIYLDPDQEYCGNITNAQACSFIRSDVAKKILYDNISYQYFREESDFYERIKSAGYKIYYLGDFLHVRHRMDLTNKGGNRKHSVSFKNELKYIKSHYVFLKNHNSFAIVKIVFFMLQRCLKHLGSIFNTDIVKNILSRIKL